MLPCVVGLLVRLWCRQLNGLAFGTLAVERQSRGAIHVHSMVWADPSDSVQ